MKTKLLFKLTFLFVSLSLTAQTHKGLHDDKLQPTIRYQVHEQSTGWYPWTSERSVVGQKRKRLEAIKIYPINFPTGASLQYRVHVRKLGWMGWKNAGEIAGTTGQKRRIEAIEIRLTNFPATSICYWAKAGYRQGSTTDSPGTSQNCDGRMVGSTGRRRPLDKISIWLEPR